MKREAKTLIVDDSTAVLDVMNEILTGYGVREVTEAEDGIKALSHFQEALLMGVPYSLVFLDIIMPELDGQETLKRMRALESNAAIAERSTIIMVTSLHSPDDMMNAIIGGDCDDYLVKPFEAEHLQHMLVKYGFLERS